MANKTEKVDDFNASKKGVKGLTQPLVPIVPRASEKKVENSPDHQMVKPKAPKRDFRREKEKPTKT